MDKILDVLSSVSTPVWVVLALAAALLIWAAVNSVKNKQAEEGERALSAAPADLERTAVEPVSAFDGLSDDVIAVITAAVYATMGSNCRINSVRRVGKAARSNWARTAIAERTAPFCK